jgi:hypothetical protein
MQSFGSVRCRTALGNLSCLRFVIAAFHYKLHINALVCGYKTVDMVLILSGNFVESNFSVFGICITVLTRRKSINHFHVPIMLSTSLRFIRFSAYIKMLMEHPYFGFGFPTPHYT